MNPTPIEWVKNQDGSQGYTVNHKTGCLNCTSDGLCLGGLFPCFAYKLANGRLKSRYLANQNIAPLSGGFADIGMKINDPFYPRRWPEKLEQIRRRRKPAGIFLDDMSDWMADYWPEEWTEAELQVMRDCPQHRFYTLTKQSQNLINWSPFPDNCWVGVTATNRKQWRKAQLHLDSLKAKIKFVSCEPLLEATGISPYDLSGYGGGINWVIIGAQTKPTVYPRIEWVQEIVEACDKARIPVFLKDNLLELVNYVDKKTDFAFNEEGYYRQEMPG